jgi:hypothetical protein
MWRGMDATFEKKKVSALFSQKVGDEERGNPG